MAYRIKRRRAGLGVVAGGTDVNAPVVTTHWWCPVPGLPVSTFDQWLGCPSVNGLAPYGVGAQPSSAAAETALSVGDSFRYAPIQAPPVVGSQPDSTPPASGSDAQAAIDATIAAQNAAWKAQNMATMNQTLANLKQEAQAQCPGEILIDNGNGTWSCPSDSPGTNWLLYAGLALAGVVGVGLLVRR